MISLTALLVSIMQKSGIDNNNQAFTWMVPILDEPISLCKIIVWISFVFQNSYGHLIYTQHWSFLGSILNERQAATFFATIAGVASLSSTLAGTILSKFVDRIGLAGLLIGASFSCFASLLCADKAYSIAEKVRFFFVKGEKNPTRYNIKLTKLHILFSCMFTSIQFLLTEWL